MNQQHRQADQDLIARIWFKVSPYFHVISVAALLIFTLGSKSTTVEAHSAALIEHATELKDHDIRLKVLENNIEKENQQLQDLIDFFGIKNGGKHNVVP